MTKITLKQIDNKIATFTTNRDKLRLLAHEIAMLVMRHAAPKEVNADCMGSGDCTRAAKLMQAMPKSWMEQMQVWFDEFSPIRVRLKNDKCEFDPKYKKLSKEDKIPVWRLEEAAQTPFWEYSAEPDAKPAIPFEKLLQMFLEAPEKRIDKLIEDGRIPEQDIPSARALVERLQRVPKGRVNKVNDNNKDEAIEDAA